MWAYRIPVIVGIVCNFILLLFPPKNERVKISLGILAVASFSFAAGAAV